MSNREDDSNTKEKLLRVAKAEFAKKGFAGARMDAIAAKAKLNKGMLYYYFGSKEKLYTTVLSNSLRHLKPEYLQAIQSFSSPDEQFFAFLYFFVQLNLKFTDDDSNRMWVWEIAEGGKFLRNFLATDMHDFVFKIKEIIVEGIEKNIFIDHDIFLHLVNILFVISTFEHRKIIFNKDKNKIGEEVFAQGYQERFLHFVMISFFQSILKDNSGKDVSSEIPNAITQKIDDLLTAENVYIKEESQKTHKRK